MNVTSTIPESSTLNTGNPCNRHHPNPGLTNKVATTIRETRASKLRTGMIEKMRSIRSQKEEQDEVFKRKRKEVRDQILQEASISKRNSIMGEDLSDVATKRTRTDYSP